jgi:uncharacterized protein with HEPN domain
MLDHAREAVDIASGHLQAELAEDRQLELSLVYLVGIAGKATARFSAETPGFQPSIHWRQVSGVGSRLIQEYDNVDLALLWDTIQDDLPPLIVELERIVGGE